MDTKEQLIQIIKQWVKYDNDIRLLKKEVNLKTKEKLEINEQLMKIMRNNEIDCFDIKDGQICYKKKNVKKPITKKYLMDVLLKYHDYDLSKASDVSNFIDDNREEVVKEVIERKIKK